MVPKSLIWIVLIVVAVVIATNFERITGAVTDISKQHSKCLTDTYKKGYEPVFSVSPKEIQKEGEKITITVESGCTKNKMYLCKVGKTSPIKTFFSLRSITALGDKSSKARYCDTNKFDKKLFPLTFEKVIYISDEGEYYISIEDTTSKKFYGQLIPEAHFIVK